MGKKIFNNHFLIIFLIAILIFSGILLNSTQSDSILPYENVTQHSHKSISILTENNSPDICTAEQLGILNEYSSIKTSTTLKNNIQHKECSNICISSQLIKIHEEFFEQEWLNISGKSDLTYIIVRYIHCMDGKKGDLS